MYIVAYDITEDNERRQVSRILDGYGQRVQRSVYLCSIPARTAHRMFAALEELHLCSGFILAWRIGDKVSPECLGVCPENLALEPVRVFVV